MTSMLIRQTEFTPPADFGDGVDGGVGVGADRGEEGGEGE